MTCQVIRAPGGLSCRSWAHRPPGPSRCGSPLWGRARRLAVGRDVRWISLRARGRQLIGGERKGGHRVEREHAPCWRSMTPPPRKGRSPLGLTHPPGGLTDDNETDLCPGHAGTAGNSSFSLPCGAGCRLPVAARLPHSGMPSKAIGERLFSCSAIA